MCVDVLVLPSTMIWTSGTWVLQRKQDSRKEEKEKDTLFAFLLSWLAQVDWQVFTWVVFHTKEGFTQGLPLQECILRKLIYQDMERAVLNVNKVNWTADSCVFTFRLYYAPFPLISIYSILLALLVCRCLNHHWFADSALSLTLSLTCVQIKNARQSDILRNWEFWSLEDVLQNKCLNWRMCAE